MAKQNDTHRFDTGQHQSIAKAVSVPEPCGSRHHEPAVTNDPDTGKRRDDGRERQRLSAPLSLRPRRLGDAALLKSPQRKLHRAVTPRVKEALARLRAVFRGTAGGELAVTDAAGLAGLDNEVCHTLLRMLRDTGVLEQRRSGVFAAVRN